jgi:hypothetical protein
MPSASWMGMVGADPAQPDHARLGQLLQARGVQAHPEQPGPLRLVAGDPVAQDAAPLEREGRPPGLHHPAGAVEADRGRRDRTARPANRAGHPVPVPGRHDPQPLGPQPRLRRQEPWRARYPETGAPGSASGLGKRARSNPGTAPQADSTEPPTAWTLARCRSIPWPSISGRSVRHASVR